MNKNYNNNNNNNNNVVVVSNKLWSNKSSTIKSFYLDISNKENFINNMLSYFDFGVTYSILIRVKYDYSKYGMVGHQIGFHMNTSDDLFMLDDLYYQIVNRLHEFDERYIKDYLDSIQLLFVEVSGLAKLKVKNINNLPLNKRLVKTKYIKTKFNSKLLPLTINSNYFGKLLTLDESSYYINNINRQLKLLLKEPISIKDYDSIYLYNSNIILNKKLSDTYYIRDLYNTGLGSFEGRFIDSIIDDTTFKRKHNNTSFVITENKVINLIISKELTKINKFSSIENKENQGLVSNPFIGTFDLETFEDEDGYAKVYAVGFCTLDNDPRMFYRDNDKDDLLLKCVNEMLSYKYNGYKFYIHNLNYDGVFLIHKLKTYNKLIGFYHYLIKPLFRDNDLLKLEIKVRIELNDRKQSIIGVRRQPGFYKITFIDSANLLKGSLRNLSKAFDLDEIKGYFPYKFVKKNTLNYVGNIPDYSYWDKTPLEEYINLYKSNWNLKEECLKYLKTDLLTLLNIMEKFSKYINRKFDVELTDCLTVSRLSLNIYLKHYLNNHIIPIIKGNMYDDIKQGYYGGITEVYKPYGKNLYYYDINSLYPTAALNPMCGTKSTYIECLDDNTSNLDLNYLFGFFYCEIITTTNNYLGLLPVRRPEGLIMPNGQWKGWYFSEELKFAVKNGYKVRVIKGYNFNKELHVFDEYIKDLYAIKSTTNNPVEKAVSKSLLNNLLGRFGLNIEKPVTDIVNRNTLDQVISTKRFNSFNSFKQITEDDFIISYYPDISKTICESHGLD
jgi:hypothetical protein